MLRPLAGFWFLNPMVRWSYGLEDAQISVPLRGSSSLASPVATGEVASNASRWGRLCLAFISDAMKVYSLRSWRPLRHTACATSPALAGEALGYNGIIASPVATGEVASKASRWGGIEHPLITYARFHQHSESHQPQQYPVLPAESLHTH